MNRVVREHYPVEKLPEDLQQHLGGQQRVTVTLVWDDGSDAPRPEHLKSLEELFAVSVPVFESLDSVASHVRSLRDD